MTSLLFVATATLISAMTTAVPNVYASEDNDNDCEFGQGNCGSGSCYERGVEDGRNNNFGDFFKIDPSGDCDGGEFLPRYHQGFIDGCMDAGNDKETCERFTDL
jgi:hypothetical protein